MRRGASPEQVEESSQVAILQRPSRSDGLWQGCPKYEYWLYRRSGAQPHTGEPRLPVAMVGFSPWSRHVVESCHSGKASRLPPRMVASPIRQHWRPVVTEATVDHCDSSVQIVSATETFPELANETMADRDIRDGEGRRPPRKYLLSQRPTFLANRIVMSSQSTRHPLGASIDLAPIEPSSLDPELEDRNTDDG